MLNGPLKKLAFIFGVIFVGNLVGCDQISSLMGQKKSSAPTAVAPTASQPTQTQPQEDPNAPLPEGVLAQIGSWTMTVTEFNKRLKSLKEVVPDFDASTPASKKLILDELVHQQLLVTEAEGQGLGGKKEIVEAVEEFKKSLLVREAVLRLTEGIKVTVEEAQDFYDKNKDSLKEPSEYHLREIVLPAQAAAKDLLVELLKGADFAELAKTHSKAPTAASGGDMGFIQVFPFPQMETAIFPLEAGDLSSVFKGPNGDYYIVKLEEKRGGKQKDFAQMKDDIVAYLTQSKQQEAIVNQLNQLKAKTVVKINESLLNGVKP